MATICIVGCLLIIHVIIRKTEGLQDQWALFGDTLYRTFPLENKTFESARKICKNKGGDLPQPKSLGENNFLIDGLPGDSFFLGMKKPPPGNATHRQQSPFVWVGRSEVGENQSFTNWASVELNLTGADSPTCAVMLKGSAHNMTLHAEPKKWTKVPCNVSHLLPDLDVVCQKKQVWQSFVNTLYKVFTPEVDVKALTMNSAHQTCRDNGGRLPEPKNSQENEFLCGLWGDSFFLGMEVSNSQVLRWKSDDSEVDQNYTHWATTSDSSLTESCVMMPKDTTYQNRSGFWKNVPCDDTGLDIPLSIVCEITKPRLIVVPQPQQDQLYEVGSEFNFTCEDDYNYNRTDYNSTDYNSTDYILYHNFWKELKRVPLKGRVVSVQGGSYQCAFITIKGEKVRSIAVDIRVDYCKGRTYVCNNGGTCVNMLYLPACKCTEKYYGDNCESEYTTTTEEVEKPEVLVPVPGCPDIATTEHLVVERLSKGAFVKFSCGAGFRRDGPENISCNGQVWSEQPPKCVDDVSTGAATSTPEQVAHLSVRHPGNQCSCLESGWKVTLSCVLAEDTAGVVEYNFKRDGHVVHTGVDSSWTLDSGQLHISGVYTCLTKVNGQDLKESNMYRLVDCSSAHTPCGDKDQRCEVTGEDYRCVCRQGYQKQHDNNVPPICEDVDECRTTKDICTNKVQHKCVNTNGSYYCVCQKGYDNIGPQFCDTHIPPPTGPSDLLDQMSLQVRTVAETLHWTEILFFTIVILFDIKMFILTIWRLITTEPVPESDSEDEEWIPMEGVELTPVADARKHRSSIGGIAAVSGSVGSMPDVRATRVSLSKSGNYLVVTPSGSKRPSLDFYT